MIVMSVTWWVIPCRFNFTVLPPQLSLPCAANSRLALFLDSDKSSPQFHEKRGFKLQRMFLAFTLSEIDITHYQLTLITLIGKEN